MEVESQLSEYELNPREQRFADEYIVNGRNATQAYKLISPNAKSTTCATKGLEMVRRESVGSYIKDKTIERLNASSLTAQDVIDQLIEVGFAKKRKGYSKQIDLQTDEVIQEIEYYNTAKAEDQLKALELLGKSMALFTDKQEINATVTPVFIDDISGVDDE